MKITKQFSGNSHNAFLKAENSNFQLVKTVYSGIYNSYTDPKDVVLIVYPTKKTERNHSVKSTELYFTELEAKKLLAQLSELLL